MKIDNILMEPTKETIIESIGKEPTIAIELQLINETIRLLSSENALVLWMYREFSGRRSVYSIENLEHAKRSFQEHQARPASYNPVLAKIYSNPLQNNPQ